VVRYPYYSVTFHGICDGPEGTEEFGALTQMAVFHRVLPKNEILIPDEYTQSRGQQELFNTIATYNYSIGHDIRSDEQKILDEATYYINYLSYNINDEEEPRNYEIYLDRILHFMTKYTVSIETLRSILTDAGWSVVDRENGPVVLNPSEDSSDDEMSDSVDNDYINTEDDWDSENSINEEFDSTNVENIWDYVTGSPIYEISANANEEYSSQQNPHAESWHEESNIADEDRWDYVINPPINELLADANEEYLSQQNPHTENWHEEPNITDENRWNYIANPPINEISADVNEYSSQQNPDTENWHEESNITNENRWDYVTNSSIDEILLGENEEYLSEQNLHTESRHNSSNFTNEEDRWDYESGVNETFADIDEEYLSMQNLHTKNWSGELNVTNENRWDNESGSSINQIFADANEEYLSAQNSHIENWHEEPSIIIPENCSINQENTYLFDGENSPEESLLSKESHATYNDTKHSEVKNTVESLIYTERELSSDLTALTLNNIEVIAQVTACNMSSVAFNNSLQLKTSVDDVTIEPTLLQNDQINLRNMQRVTSMLNFSPHMSVSRSSTSPASLCFSSEINNSLQDFNAYYQNESLINNQSLLNSTFYQSEIATEAASVNTEKSIKDIPCFKQSLPEKDVQGDEINFSLHMPLNYNCNVEQGKDISDKNKTREDNSMADVISSDEYNSFNNQPKYTSSPHTKMPTTNSCVSVSKSLKYRELIPVVNSNVLLDTTEEIEETVSDTTDSVLEARQKFNSNVVETIKLYATSSDSDITNTSKHDKDFSASNSSQKILYLENKKFNGINNSVSTKLIQDTNQEFTENAIINHKSDVMDDIRNVDAHHILSLDDENINHKDKNIYCTLAKTDLTDTDAKAHLKNVISDLAQSSIRKKGLNPPRELLSSKSQNISKYFSTGCAKEISVLKNDGFVPCKNNEDTSNVYLTSVLKNEENVGTSKDISNFAVLMNNIEAKSSSPLETPPNSWSPEIMDSGYPNSASAQDITPEYELPSIAQDYIPDSESPSIAEAPRLGVLEPIEVENGDLANNNRDDEGNNMMAVDVNDIENLQPLIDVLENDLENENDIYVMQNGFPIWLLRILDMANPLDFDMQARQNLRIPDEIAGNCISLFLHCLHILKKDDTFIIFIFLDDANYVGHDEGFDSSSSESENDVAYNEMEDDNGPDK